MSSMYEQTVRTGAFGRAGGYSASLSTFGLGFLEALWNPNRQTIHDRISGTVVLRCSRKRAGLDEAQVPPLINTEDRHQQRPGREERQPHRRGDDLRHGAGHDHRHADAARDPLQMDIAQHRNSLARDQTAGEKFHPPDLTQLAKRNGGDYPTKTIRRIVDGREPLKGRGGPDMPAWGDAFKNAETGFDDEQVRLKIESVVAHLERLQEQ